MPHTGRPSTASETSTSAFSCEGCSSQLRAAARQAATERENSGREAIAPCGSGGKPQAARPSTTRAASARSALGGRALVVEPDQRAVDVRGGHRLPARDAAEREPREGDRRHAALRVREVEESPAPPRRRPRTGWPTPRPRAPARRAARSAPAAGAPPRRRPARPSPPGRAPRAAGRSCGSRRPSGRRPRPRRARAGRGRARAGGGSRGRACRAAPRRRARPRPRCRPARSSRWTPGRRVSRPAATTRARRSRSVRMPSPPSPEVDHHGGGLRLGHALRRLADRRAGRADDERRAQQLAHRARRRVRGRVAGSPARPPAAASARRSARRPAARAAARPPRPGCGSRARPRPRAP